MTWFYVAAFAWACPGGWFAPAVPITLRPLVCAPSVALERYDPARRAAAEDRVRSLGPAARLYRCDARRCRLVPVVWRTVTIFGE